MVWTQKFINVLCRRTLIVSERSATWFTHCNLYYFLSLFPLFKQSRPLNNYNKKKDLGKEKMKPTFFYRSFSYLSCQIKWYEHKSLLTYSVDVHWLLAKGVLLDSLIIICTIFYHYFLLTVCCSFHRKLIKKNSKCFPFFYPFHVQLHCFLKEYCKG